MTVRPQSSATSLHNLHTMPRLRPTSTPRGTCTAHFGELRGPLLEFINRSPVVVGCVAWITSGPILEALAKRPVALVVQKEDWWKKSDPRGQALVRRYAALQGGVDARNLPAPAREPLAERTVLSPITCVGYGGASHLPLMHHKFIVRCDISTDGALVPVAVWTGSFNFSGNANDSLENAVEIHDPSIASAYLAEFALVASLSEPMAWRFKKPAPNGKQSAAVAVPRKPKKTTMNVVKAGTRRTAKKTPAKKANARKPTKAPAQVTTIGAAKKAPARKTTTAKKVSARPVRKVS